MLSLTEIFFAFSYRSTGKFTGSGVLEKDFLSALGLTCGMNLIGGVSTLNYLISRGDGVKLPNVCLFQEVSSEEYTWFVSLTSTC